MKSEVKDTIFPISMFIGVEILLLTLAGIHYKLLIFLNDINVVGSDLLIIIILYWIFMATLLTFIIKHQIKKHYDEPLKAISKATGKVANGDFSVYVPPLNTADKTNYLDDMIMNFNKMVEELGSIETLKTDFFANVSHEIKTPIAVISNAAEMLKKDDLDEQKMEYVDTIIMITQKLSGLITNILKLNKLEKQKIQPNVEEYDLCRQLCESIVKFSPQWEKKELEFEADLEDEALICADEGIMELVWDNLISNAIKFSKIGGTIRVIQKSECNNLVVKVQDYGCGMSKETSNMIFEKFYQGDTSHSTEGNGLGLALVRRCLEIMGGTISVDSNQNKGSIFTVVIPKG